ncbi:MAG: D-alanyl-D-alanine carboxypeptidase, partial [Verrucomicrobiales bacterium]|nr:D-alanyl-D-alanine carboxypeptidase [Verrucomicrobiales bacterium]
MSSWISRWSFQSFFPILISLGLVACGSQQQSAAPRGPGSTAYYGGNPPAAIAWNPQNPQGGYSTPTPAPAPVDPYYISATPLPMSASAPRIRAESYLLIDARTGANLASVGADVHRGVASTQKLLTALVVLDAGNLDSKVRVAASDVAVEPTKLGIRPGDVYTRRELLYAFLIKSCNDVANVLARDNAGSISAFAAKMNAKMRSLGGTDSNFRNPHGLTAPGQYSTARNMARVAMAAYRNQIIRDAVRRTSFTFRYA